MGAGNVSVRAVSNLLFDVVFQNALGQFDQTQMTAAISGGGTVAISTTRGGAVGAGVNVTYGATVELAGGLNIARETLTLNGNGEGNVAAIPLRSVSGLNTWQGNMILNSNRTGIEVESGSRLTIQGIVSNQSFNLFGGGVLELAGTAANTMSQTNIVWDGILKLNKAAGVNAIASGLTIGGYVDSVVSPRALLLQDNQIAPTQALTLNGEGVFDMGGSSDTVGSLTVNIAPNASPVLTTGTGTLTVNGNLTVGVISGGRASGATISGNLALGGSAARTVTVNDSNALEDLVIDGVLSDAAAGWTKAGGGRMVLQGTSPNTYTGLTTITVGELVARKAGALGEATQTVVVQTITGTDANRVDLAGALVLDGGFTFEKNLQLNSRNNNGNYGQGFQNSGALRSQGGSNILKGNVLLSTTDNTNNFATVRVVVGSGELIIDGTVSRGTVTTAGIGLTKLGDGALEFRGNAANTYGSPGTGASGVTSVAQGTLRLNKNAGVAAVSGRLEVGNNTGLAGSAQLLWMADEQFADQAGVNNALLTIETDGYANLNGFKETILGPGTNSFFLRLGTTLSGTFDLNGGTLTFGSGAALGSGVNSTVYANSPAGRILDSSAGSTGKVVLASGNGAWNSGGITNMLREIEVSAQVESSGTGRLLKTGTGAIALTANNTGLTTNVDLNAGVLILGHNGALGAGTLNVGGTGTIRGGVGGPAITLSNNVTLNANLTVAGDSNFTITGSISGQGAANRTITSAAAQSATVTLAGAVNLSNDGTSRTLVLTNNSFNNAMIVSGAIANGSGTAHNLQISGNDAVVLAGNNTYTGNTTVSAGSLLRVAHASALGAGLNAIVEVTQSGAIEIDGSGTINGVNKDFTITGKVLRIRATGTPGYGFKNNFTGAIYNVGGDNTWSNPGTGAGLGAVDLRGENTTTNRQFWIGSVSGTLNIEGQIAGTQSDAAARQGHTLFKTGPGTVRFSGGEANLTTGIVTIDMGTLALNKTSRGQRLWRHHDKCGRGGWRRRRAGGRRCPEMDPAQPDPEHQCGDHRPLGPVGPEQPGRAVRRAEPAAHDQPGAGLRRHRVDHERKHRAGEQQQLLHRRRHGGTNRGHQRHGSQHEWQPHHHGARQLCAELR